MVSRPHDPAIPKLKGVWPWMLLFVAAFLVYLPNLSGERVWDDTYLIDRNPFFRSPVFLFEVFRHHLYPESISLYYRPVQNLSYILDYWLWGENTAGYHLANILYHGLSGGLLFALLRRILPPLLPLESSRVDAIAWLVSLVWVVHPIHHAAVAYIAGRADSLACLLSLSGWMIYLRAERESRFWRQAALWLLAAGLAVLALCAKEIAVVWLALFAGWFLFFREEPSVAPLSRPRLLRFFFLLLCLGLIVGGWGFLRQLPPHRDAPPGMEGLESPARLMLMLRALGDYVRILVFPSELHMERTVISEFGYRNAQEWQALVGYEFLAVLGALAMAAALLMARYNGPGRKLRLFGLLWFVIGFLPISNLIPLVATVAEHWIYMPSIGALLFAAGCIVELPERWIRGAFALGIAVAIGLGVRTAFKVGDWRDGETFFRKTIEATGGSARMRVNLAQVYSERGDLQEAERQLRQAADRYPNSPMILTNLGGVLLKQRRVEEAQVFLDAAKNGAAELPTWTLESNRAKVLLQQGRKAEALETLVSAQKRFPESWQLIAHEARIRSEIEGPKAALPAMERYARSHWWSYDAHLHLGEFYRTAGEPDSAIRVWQHAARLDIRKAEPFSRIAKLEADRGRLEEGLRAIQKAIRREPGRLTPYLTAAGILKKLGREEAAAEMIEKARGLNAEAGLAPRTGSE